MNQNGNYSLTKDESIFLEIIHFLLNQSSPNSYSPEVISMDYYNFGFDGCFYQDEKTMKFINLIDKRRGVRTIYDQKIFSFEFNQLTYKIIKNPLKDIPLYSISDKPSLLSESQKRTLNYIAKRIVLLRDL